MIQFKDQEPRVIIVQLPMLVIMVLGCRPWRLVVILEGVLCLTKQENILSFDFVMPRAAASHTATCLCPRDGHAQTTHKLLTYISFSTLSLHRLEHFWKQWRAGRF